MDGMGLLLDTSFLLLKFNLQVLVFFFSFFFMKILLVIVNGVWVVKVGVGM